MTHSVDFETMEHDPRDPNPWLALYLDHSIPVDPEVKKAWLKDSSSRCRQFVLPIVRPFARGFIMLMQLVKTVLPDSLTSSWLLHRVLSWGLRTFVTREANWLILRHFHIGSEILDFIARNVADTKVPLNPLRPANLADVRDDLFLKQSSQIDLAQRKQTLRDLYTKWYENASWLFRSGPYLIFAATWVAAALIPL